MSEPIRKIPISKVNDHVSVAPKTTAFSQQQIKDLFALTQKKRFPAPAPRPLTQQQRLQQYSSVLSKIDPSKIIRVIAEPTVTLTPAQPRDPNGKGAITLVTTDDGGSCYWDTDPAFSETGTIQMPNFMSVGYVYLTFQTVVGNSYALELQLTMGSIPPQTLSGVWEVFGPSMLMLYVPATPAQTIVTGFKASDVKSGVMVAFQPNYDPATVFGGARFLGCKLTPL
jgi:hypothetical protein